MKDKETFNTSTTWYILWIVINQHVKTITHCIFESINDHNGKIITSRTCSKEELRNTNKIRVKKTLKSLLKTLKITNTKNNTIPLNNSYVQPCMPETNPYNGNSLVATKKYLFRVCKKCSNSLYRHDIVSFILLSLSKYLPVVLLYFTIKVLTYYLYMFWLYVPK